MKKNAAHKLIEALESRIAPARIVALEMGTNQLVSFDSDAPGTLLSEVTITGLLAGEVIAGIDFRATDGTLAALGVVDDGATRTARLYKIDPVTGVATADGGFSFSGLADTGSYGFDIDPINGGARFVNNSDVNLTLSTGTAGTDSSLSDATQDEIVTAIAFDRQFGSTKTTLYGYNYQTDQLVTIGDIDGDPSSPSSGIVKPIARAKLGGVNFTSASSAGTGFDIGGDFGAPESGWIAMRQTGTTTNKLFNIDLATAALTEVGVIGDGTRAFSGITLNPYVATPTISADGKTAAWTDLDGDAVTLKITKGTLTAANFRMLDGETGSALAKLTLTDAQFTGTNITITAKPAAGLGDGKVNIGAIDANNVDIGAVSIGGDLQKIRVGVSGGPVAIKSLKAASFAAHGTTLIPSGTPVDSQISNGFGTIAITGDFAARLRLQSGGGSSLTIGGDLIGGSRDASGSINASSNGIGIDKVFIKGDIIGGDGAYSGTLAFEAKSMTIGGSVIGGDGIGSGGFTLSASPSAKLAIGGSVIGGAGNGSGTIGGNGGAISVAIKGSITSGEGAGTGSLRMSSGGTFLKSLTVGGSIVSTGGDLAIEAARIGTVKVGGDLAGYGDTGRVLLVARGIITPASVAESIAIGKLTVGGDVKNAVIGAGMTASLTGDTSDASIGSVKIGGNLIATSIVAGIARVTGGFGDADDSFIDGSTGAPAIIARIASITIGGQLIGTAGGAPDTFGILAEQIGALTIGKVKAPLTAAKDDFKLGFTSDVCVREL